MVVVRVQLGKRGVKEVNASTVGELRAEVAKLVRRSVHRVSLKIETADRNKPVRLSSDDEKMEAVLSRPELSGCDKTVVYRDLGPQIGYRTVFVIEYLGPIVMMAICAARPAIIYGAAAADAPWSQTACIGAAAFIGHFVKRELETFFVHRFSRPTMPLMNLFKNSAYYWGFAFFVSYVLCHPLYTPAYDNHVFIGGAIMALSELVNFLVHMQLRGMRSKEGDQSRKAPGGPLFALVSCPNYTAEVASWVGFSIMTNVFVSYVFTLVGFLQMTEWSLGKHRGYLRSDPNYRKLGRKAIVPFVI